MIDEQRILLRMKRWGIYKVQVKGGGMINGYYELHA
jgi:hypothetical protein